MYLLSRYMRPEGLWQRLAAALADRSPFPRLYLKKKNQILSPTTCALYPGNLSPSTHIRLTKEKEKPHDPPKQAKQKQPPSIDSSIPSSLGSATSSDSGTPFPSPLATSSALSGASAGFSVPCSLRWGGGVLHPYTGPGRCCGFGSTSTSVVG